MSKSDPYDFIFETWAKTKNQPQCSWWSSFRLGPFGFIFAFCLPFCFVGTCWNTPLVLELVDKTWWKQWLSRHKKEKTMDCDYLITPFCFYKAWNTYLKAGFGYVWIQYLIDFGENKIQGSQACRILLGSMVGIYWIYALFGGHYCLGRKGCSQNTPQKRKKTMDCDYLITPFCFYKAWNTYLKTGFGYVWIQYLIDFVEISDDFTNTDADLEPFSFISGTFWMLAWNLLDFISGTSWFYFCKPLSWMTDDFLFAQHVGLNSPDFIFAFWGSVAWVPLISFYFSGVQPHLGAPQGDIRTA